MELEKELKYVFSQFKTATSFKNFKTINSGHINDTYLIFTTKKPNYILQKINGQVFKNASQVIENKIKISKFLEKQKVKTLNFISTKNNKFYVKDEDDNCWNLSIYIEESQTFLEVKSPKVAFEAGKITGSFLAKTLKFDGELTETLPNFHSMSFRFQEFENSLKNASQKRKEKAKNWIDFALSKKEEMLVLEAAIIQKEIPFRVTHNDTKVSNILFDKNKNAICMIDLDTVMKGVIHFDYGDALRTICNTATEDEIDINKIDFNFDYFRNYTTGFLESMADTISKNELKFLPISIKIMTFIMGLRFLTDYLNNDIYYKTNYKEHNLDRAKNQFTFVKKIAENQQEINNFIRGHYCNYLL